MELLLDGTTYRIVRSEGGLPLGTSAGPAASGTLGGTTFVDVAKQAGLDFRQGAFRFGVSNDTTAMMGGGLCWLDYDSDGWLDLFVVNSYAQTDIADVGGEGRAPAERALPQRRRDVRGRQPPRGRRTCSCAGTAASRPTSTSTATRTST